MGMPQDLKGVKSIVCNSGTFAALKFDGSVACWGGDGNGASAFQALNDKPTNVQKIIAGADNFAALTFDNKVVCWGGSTGNDMAVWDRIGGKRSVPGDFHNIIDVVT